MFLSVVMIDWGDLRGQILKYFPALGSPLVLHISGLRARGRGPTAAEVHMAGGGGGEGVQDDGRHGGRHDDGGRAARRRVWAAGRGARGAGRRANVVGRRVVERRAL